MMITQAVLNVLNSFLTRVQRLALDVEFTNQRIYAQADDVREGDGRAIEILAKLNTVERGAMYRYFVSQLEPDENKDDIPMLVWLRDNM